MNVSPDGPQPPPVIAFFDNVAAEYGQVLPFFASFARQMRSALRLPAGYQILDLGAGRGALAGEFRATAQRLVAVDGSAHMVERLTQDYPDVEAAVMDAASLAFVDAAFDAVVAGFVIHILPDAPKAVAEVRRVLRPGGVFAFTTPGRMDGEPDPWPLLKIWSEYARYRGDGFLRMANGVNLADLLERLGFIRVVQRTLEVEIPVPDGETYWRFEQSHGAGAFIQALPADKRLEFKNRLVDAIDSAGGLTMQRSATLWTATTS